MGTLVNSWVRITSNSYCNRISGLWLREHGSTFFVCFVLFFDNTGEGQQEARDIISLPVVGGLMRGKTGAVSHQ